MEVLELDPAARIPPSTSGERFRRSRNVDDGYRGAMTAAPWIAAGLVPAPLQTAMFVLEPLGPEHNEADHRAWTQSIDHIRATPGFAAQDWGSDDWPVPMSSEQNLRDLVTHRREFDGGEAFAYSVLDGDVHEIIGCVYVDPDSTGAADAMVRCWVTAERASLDHELADAVRRWIIDAWPLKSVRFPGRWNDPAG